MLNKRELYTDEKVIKIIIDGNENAIDKVMVYLYDKYYPQLRSYIFKNKGEEIDAQDIFQDTLITFYNQVREKKYQSKSKLGTYLFSIGKYLWIAELKKRKVKMYAVPESYSQDEKNIEVMLIERNNSQIFRKLFQELSEGCKKVLTLVFFEESSVKEIQQKLSLGSEQAVRTKKFRCIQSLTSVFKKNKITKDQFTF